MISADIIIIGGGIVGLSTAYTINELYPNLLTLILEKEPDIAKHQSGRNSGVIHSGIYYKPGSLKSQLCNYGKKELEYFCHKSGISTRKVGKVIVASNKKELQSLFKLYEQGIRNKINCSIVDNKRLKEIESYASGIKSLFLPDVHIVDFSEVCYELSKHSIVIPNTKVLNVDEYSRYVTLETNKGNYQAPIVINCAGLYSDELSSQNQEYKIVPFRGEHYELKPEYSYLCNGLIYPVPDNEFPFLGVHLTKTIYGKVKCGPNAVLAYAKEGYNKSDINLKEFINYSTYPGFLRLAKKHWKTGIQELWRSYSKKKFVKSLQKLVPEIKEEYLVPSPSGVRAQAVSNRGELINDFIFSETNRVINVINAPSPAATSSFGIAKIIANKLKVKL